MSLTPQLESFDSFNSRTTIEDSPKATNAAMLEMCQKPPPGSTHDLDHDQERSPTSDSNRHLQEDGYAIDLSDAAASRKYVAVTQQQTPIAMFRKRERNLFLGGIQHETEESAGQTAAAMENCLQQLNVLKRGIPALHATAQGLRQNLDYTAGQMDQLRADNKQVWIHNSELHDKFRALEFENSELRKKNEALKNELYVYKGATKAQHPKAFNEQGRKRDLAESEFQVDLSEKSPAKKRRSLNSKT